TSQSLLANIASMYACYHGPEGLKQIAQRVHLLARCLAAGLARLGYSTGQVPFFDTLRVSLGAKSASEILKLAEARRMNFRPINEHTVGISLDETTGENDVLDILRVFNGDRLPEFTPAELAPGTGAAFPAPLGRTSRYLAHSVFNRHHSETEMLRYLKRLENRDLSLTA